VNLLQAGIELKNTFNFLKKAVRKLVQSELPDESEDAKEQILLK